MMNHVQKLHTICTCPQVHIIYFKKASPLRLCGSNMDKAVTDSCWAC